MLQISNLRLATILKVVAIPVAVGSVVTVMGMTGACPLCAALTDRIPSAGQIAPEVATVSLRAPVDDAPKAPDAPAREPAREKDAPQAPAAPDATKQTPKGEGKGEGKEAGKAPQPPVEKPNVIGTMWDRLYVDLDGNHVDLGDVAGKPMVIELWATWCGPCIRQRAHMHELSAEFPDVVFVAASVDQGGANAVRIFLAQNKSPKTSRVKELLATPELRAKLDRINNSKSIPKVAYVNRKGQLTDVSLGTQKPDFMKAMLRNLSKAN